MPIGRVLKAEGHGVRGRDRHRPAAGVAECGFGVTSVGRGTPIATTSKAS